MRRSTLPCLLLAVATLGCSDGEAVLLSPMPTEDCAPPPEISASPVPVAGDWWNAGDMPPTLRLQQERNELRADLAFSGVIRRGGTGQVNGGCVLLSFPAEGAGGRPLVVSGRLLTPSRLRIALLNDDPAVDPMTFVLERRPVAP
jgi:hypothetical protein